MVLPINDRKWNRFDSMDIIANIYIYEPPEAADLLQISTNAPAAYKVWCGVGFIIWQDRGDYNCSSIDFQFLSCSPWFLHKNIRLAMSISLFLIGFLLCHGILVNIHQDGEDTFPHDHQYFLISRCPSITAQIDRLIALVYKFLSLCLSSSKAGHFVTAECADNNSYMQCNASQLASHWLLRINYKIISLRWALPWRSGMIIDLDSIEHQRQQQQFKSSSKGSIIIYCILT